MRKTISTVLAAVAAIGFAGAAMAEEAKLTIVVPYADLDVSTPEGSAALEKRVEAAVHDVCGEPFIRDLKAVRAVEACREDARAAAMEQVALGNPYEGLELASIF